MITTAAKAVAAVAPAMATLASNAFKTRRLGDGARIYRAERKLPETPEVRAALVSLLDAGLSVRVFEGDAIWALRLADDGALVWELERHTHVNRAAAKTKYGRPYVGVEVA